MQKTFWYVEGRGGVGGVWTKTVFKSELFKTEAEAVKYEKENRRVILRAGADWIFVRRLTDSVAEVYRDFVMFLYDLDPYLICDAFEYGEGPEEFAARISGTVTAADVLGDIEDSRGLVTDEPDNMEKLDGFAKRIQALKAA